MCSWSWLVCTLPVWCRNRIRPWKEQNAEQDLSARVKLSDGLTGSNKIASVTRPLSRSSISFFTNWAIKGKLAATSLRTWQVQRVSNIIKRLKLIGKKITAELIAEAAADRDLVGRDPPIPVAVVAEVLDELRASGEFERLVAKAQPAQQPGATLPAAVGGDRYSEHSVKADGQGNAQPTG